MVQTKWHDPREKTSTIPIHIEQFPASSLAKASTPNPKLSKLPTTIKTAHFEGKISSKYNEIHSWFPPLYFDTFPKTVFGHLGNFSNAPISCENRVENSVSTQWKETSGLLCDWWNAHSDSYSSWRMKPTSFEFWCVFSWEKAHESLEMEIPYQSFKFSLLSWEMDLLENTCKRDNGRKSAMLEAQEVKQARAPHSTENFLSYRTSSHQILSHPVKVSFIGQLWRTHLDLIFKKSGTKLLA